MADQQRLAAQLGPVELLDGCVEGVHVDVEDGPVCVQFRDGFYRTPFGRRQKFNVDECDAPRAGWAHVSRLFVRATRRDICFPSPRAAVNG